MKLIGKFLIRKAKSINGHQLLTITGVSLPIDFDVESIDARDEFWVTEVEFKESGMKRKTAPNEFVSPEEFLSGSQQNLDDWKIDLTNG